MHCENKKNYQWHNCKEIIFIKVTEDIKLDDFCIKYKPDWMTKRDYRREIMELNDLSKSTLHEGQILKLYYVKEN